MLVLLWVALISAVDVLIAGLIGGWGIMLFLGILNTHGVKLPGPMLGYGTGFALAVCVSILFSGCAFFSKVVSESAS